MPDGLDSPIAQGGTNVSGGQRQRLCIARALVADPEIYLFDDSFSALDLSTDARLRAALKPHTADAAVVIVAQRVSTITDADQIIVLEDGEIVGRGTHEELRAQLPDVRGDRRVPARRGGGRMSATRPPATRRPTAPRRTSPSGRRRPERLPEAGRPGGSGRTPWMNLAMPVEKSMNFGPSAKRLLARLRPERARVAARRPAGRDQRRA